MKYITTRRKKNQLPSTRCAKIQHPKNIQKQNKKINHTQTNKGLVTRLKQNLFDECFNDNKPYGINTKFYEW